MVVSAELHDRVGREFDQRRLGWHGARSFGDQQCRKPMRDLGEFDRGRGGRPAATTSSRRSTSASATSERMSPTLSRSRNASPIGPSAFEAERKRALPGDDEMRPGRPAEFQECREPVLVHAVDRQGRKSLAGLGEDHRPAGAELREPSLHRHCAGVPNTPALPLPFLSLTDQMSPHYAAPSSTTPRSHNLFRRRLRG